MQISVSAERKTFASCFVSGVIDPLLSYYYPKWKRADPEIRRLLLEFKFWRLVKRNLAVNMIYILKPESSSASVFVGGRSKVRYYNCSKFGHIARACKVKKASHTIPSKTLFVHRRSYQFILVYPKISLLGYPHREVSYVTWNFSPTNVLSPSISCPLESKFQIKTTCPHTTRGQMWRSSHHQSMIYFSCTTKINFLVHH